MKKTNINKRNEQIYRLREGGATFRHIGSLFNITGNRASQVYYRIKDRKEWPPLKQMLSSHAHEILKRCFKTEDILFDPKKIADTCSRVIWRGRTVGWKTIKEIAHALENLGYIKSISEWTKPIKMFPWKFNSSCVSECSGSEDYRIQCVKRFKNKTFSPRPAVGVARRNCWRIM